MATKSTSKSRQIRKKAVKELFHNAGQQLAGATKTGLAVVGAGADLLSANPVDAVKMMGHAVKSSAHTLKHWGKAIANVGKVIFNHPEWYTNYDLTNLVNLNFGRRKSLNSTMVELLGGSSTLRQGTEISAMGAIDTSLVIPKDSLDSFTQAINILYSKIRSANSGNVNFTPAELAAYILNVRSVRAAIAMGNRAIGLSNYTNVYDANVPNILTSVSLGSTQAYSSDSYYGIPFETLLANKADFTNYLNTWSRTIRAMYPINIPLLDRTDWMFSNVFKDSNDAKANYWLFYTTSLPYYTVGDGQSLTRVNVELFNEASESGAQEYSEFLSAVDTLFNVLASNPVNAIIAGDILKTYGDTSMYNQMMINSEYYCEPIYDEAALTQIQNCTPVGRVNTTEYTETYTFGGNHSITFSRNENAYDIGTENLTSRLVNTYKDNITPGEVISYTRLSTIFSVDSTNGTVITCGSEIVNNVNYVMGTTTNNNNTYGLIVSTGTLRVAPDELTDVSWTSQAQIINAWTIMDWAPLTIIPFGSGQTAAWMWDVNNFAVATQSDLDNFNQIATLSLLWTSDYIKRQNEFNLNIK